jgi:hypothetical protein
LVVPRERHSLGAIRRLANQLKLLLALKEQLQTIIEQGMIFDRQDTELAAPILVTRHGVLTSHVQSMQRLGSFVQNHKISPLVPGDRIGAT